MKPMIRRYWAKLSRLTLVVILLSGCQVETKRPSLGPSATFEPGSTDRAVIETIQPTLGTTDTTGLLTPTSPGPGEYPDPSFSEITPVVTIDTQIDLAIADLSARIKIDSYDIQIVDQYPDEFPASGLGCPPGKTSPLPIPALVSGKVIILRAADIHYIYHARQMEVVYCGTDVPESSSGK